MKNKQKHIYLKYLPKQKGGRIENLTTFKKVCNSKEASTQLVGIKSLKDPLESDSFIHVVLSKYKNEDLIVKIQEPGKMLTTELKIQKELANQTNVVHYICDFPCLFNSTWKNPIEKPKTFCDTEGTEYHMIIMEYINNDLADFLEKDHTQDNLISIVKQVGFSLLEIHMNHKIHHGDINRGNLLVDFSIPKEIEYKVGKYSKKVNTLGYEFVLIDFQRGNIIKTEEEDTLFQLAIDEISLAYELMSKWSGKKILESLMNRIMICKSVEEVFSILGSL